MSIYLHHPFSGGGQNPNLDWGGSPTLGSVHGYPEARVLLALQQFSAGLTECQKSLDDGHLVIEA